MIKAAADLFAGPFKTNAHENVICMAAVTISYRE
jgi:hypothetical protein